MSKDDEARRIRRKYHALSPEMDERLRRQRAATEARDHGWAGVSLVARGPDFKNAGREGLPKGEPEKVRVHDFQDKALGKVVPYGVYDILDNQGWVSVGIDHDTAQFATNSIRRWWDEMGVLPFSESP